MPISLQGTLFPAIVEWSNGRFVSSLSPTAPLVVSLGVGTDSVAMLIEMKRRGVRPDAIVVALVGRDGYGNEHRRFYSYLPVIENWCIENGFPAVTYVSYSLKKKAKHFHYVSLAGACLSNRTLPSLAFRMNHSCSLKFKGSLIDAWVTRTFGATPCLRALGYDAMEVGRANRMTKKTKSKGVRFAKPKVSRKHPRANDLYVHPLQLWGITRADCIATISQEGLPQPGKSSCIFCPSLKPHELRELFPDELWRIVIIEAHAQIKLKKIKGLWGHQGSMTDFIRQEGLLPNELIDVVWNKLVADQRPSVMEDNPDATADEVLFNESYYWAERCGEHRLPVVLEV